MIGVRAVVAAVAVLCVACTPTKEVSRVSIPGTTLTVVVVQDEKRMYRYRVFEGETQVSDERVFSGYSTEPLPPPIVEESAGVVRISWRKADHEIFLEFDRQTGQIVRDSNEADHPSDHPIPARAMKSFDQLSAKEGSEPTDSSVAELTDAQRAELQKRIDDDDAHPNDVVPWDQAKASTLALLRK